MKVQFKNAEIDVWKLRKGVVVMCGGHIGHIERIGLPESGNFDEGVLCMDIFSTHVENYVMSTEVTWVEPH